MENQRNYAVEATKLRIRVTELEVDLRRANANREYVWKLVDELRGKLADSERKRESLQDLVEQLQDKLAARGSGLG